MGKDKPDSGNIKVGETVNMIGVGQDRMEELDATKSVFEEITGGQDELELGSLDSRVPSSNKLLEI